MLSSLFTVDRTMTESCELFYSLSSLGRLKKIQDETKITRTELNLKNIFLSLCLLLCKSENVYRYTFNPSIEKYKGSRDTRRERSDGFGLAEGAGAES